MDISPDGNTLAVADRAYSATEGWIHLVDLNTSTSQRVTYPLAFYEGGSWTVAYGSDGKLLVTTTFLGSGWVPLRSYDPINGLWTTISSVRQDTMLTPSADTNTIAYVEANISSGPLSLYLVPTSQLIPLASTNWFTYEVGVNANGTQLAVPTYGGTYFFDNNHTQLGLIGTYAGPQPIGVVYHPVENRVYFPWTYSTEVREYDATTLTQVGSYDFQDNFSSTGNWAFVQGRMKISRDGSILMASVTGGVRFVQMYAGLQATDMNLAGFEDTPLSINLSGSIGNGGALNYAVASTPSHGQLTGAAPNLIYTPDPNYNGTDSFSYQVSYGKANVNATINLTMAAVNDAPIANPDTATTKRNTSISIAVLNNDTDVDGDALSITSVTQPKSGTVTISSDTKSVTYKPRRRFTGIETFNYTISDPSGATSTAQVTVNVIR